jgi:Holliday junction resolvase
MAMTPEAKVKAKIKKLLDDNEVYHFSPFQAGMGRAGIPDIIACFKGTFIGIEAKAGDNKPTMLQERELDKIRKSGGHALVVNETNLESLEFLIKHIKGE